MKPIQKSSKLHNVCYDIRGPVLEHAKRLEDEGQHILKLNIGNPAPFGFTAPDEIVQDVIHNLPDASGYCDSKGLFSARKAVMHYTQQKGIKNVGIEDIFLGNGVSELIVMSMQALLNNGDEVLIPAPYWVSYPEMVKLAGATPKIVLAGDDQGFKVSPAQIEEALTPATKLLILNSPSNPTGCLYDRAEMEAIIDLAIRKDILVMSDEIYEYLLYDGSVHHRPASFSEEARDRVITVSGFSKTFSNFSSEIITGSSILGNKGRS